MPQKPDEPDLYATLDPNSPNMTNLGAGSTAPQFKPDPWATIGTPPQPSVMSEEQELKELLNNTMMTLRGQGAITIGDDWEAVHMALLVKATINQLQKLKTGGAELPATAAAVNASLQPAPDLYATLANPSLVRAPATSEEDQLRTFFGKAVRALEAYGVIKVIPGQDEQVKAALAWVAMNIFEQSKVAKDATEMQVSR